MNTRVTNSMTINNYLSAMRTNLNNLSSSNEKLSTQRSFTKASENVSDAARALRIRKLMNDNERNTSSAEELSDRLDTAESNLRTLSSIYQQMSDLVTQGLSGTLSDQDRQIVANQVESLRDEALSISNSAYSEKYLFSSSGNADGSAPFVVGSDGLLYYNGNNTAIDDMVTDSSGNAATDNGDGTTTEIDYNETNYLDIGLGLSTTGSGSSLQLDTRTAVKSSLSGMDIFGYGTDDNGVPKNFYGLFTQIASDISSNSSSGLSKDLTALSASHDVLLIGLADVGNTSSFVEDVTTQLNDDLVSLQEMQTSIEGVDLAEEIMYNSEFEMAWTVTLQLGANILPTSIFDFL